MYLEVCVKCGAALPSGVEECPVCWEDVVRDDALWDVGEEVTCRSRGERRKKDFAKAMRKRAIDRKRCPNEKPWYGNLHQYSKNKIHCSCEVCSSKTRDRKRYGKVEYWKHSDAKKRKAMECKMKEVI